MDDPLRLPAARPAREMIPGLIEDKIADLHDAERLIDGRDWEGLRAWVEEQKAIKRFQRAHYPYVDVSRVTIEQFRHWRRPEALVA